MPAPRLELFTAPCLTGPLGLQLFAKLFARFSLLLPSGFSLPIPCDGNDCFFDSLAHILERRASELPDCLIQAFQDIEAAAAALHHPETLPATDPNRDPDNTASARLRQAIELWLAHHPAPAPAKPAETVAPHAPTLPPSDAPTLNAPTLPPSDAPTLNAPTLPPSDAPTLNAPTLSPSDAPTPPHVPHEPDADAFLRLARLPTPEYDRLRLAEAKRLGLRVRTLDAQVARCRSQLSDDAQAYAVRLPTLTPWPAPVLDAPQLLAQVSSCFTCYIALPPGAADVFALWSQHAHAVAAFHLTPRLNLYSPRRGCGKTTTLDVLATLVPRPFRTDNMRPAVLFRVVDQQQPTLLLDEVDTYLHQANELRGLLNAGHKRGACAYRCEGAGNAIRSFRAFAPAALAGIGALPATLHDRSILIPLVAAQPGQLTARFDEHHTDLEQTLARQLARWAKDNLAALAACDPPLPATAFNRLADNWRPLFAVAQVVGGDWPQRAAEAFAKLTPKSNPDPDDSQLLLSDIRLVFTQSGASRLFSSTLIQALSALPDRPWSRLNTATRPSPKPASPAASAPSASAPKPSASAPTAPKATPSPTSPPPSPASSPTTPHPPDRAGRLPGICYFLLFAIRPHTDTVPHPSHWCSNPHPAHADSVTHPFFVRIPKPRRGDRQ